MNQVLKKKDLQVSSQYLNRFTVFIVCNVFSKYTRPCLDCGSKGTSDVHSEEYILYSIVLVLQEPIKTIDYYIKHREEREQSILKILEQFKGEPKSVEDIVRQMYSVSDVIPIDKLYRLQCPSAEMSILT